MGEYVYDEGGFRVRKSARFAKAGLTQDVEILYPSKFYGLEYASETNTLSSVNNIYLNGVRIAALNEGGGTAYYLTDQVDSVSTVLDEDGKTLSRIQYQPYGETFVHKGDTDFSPKYNSQELDKETNFYFYNARYYDPAIARFTSADTVIPNDLNTQSWNRFSYVEGNPIRYKDPTGHAPEDVAEGASEEAKSWAIENLKSGVLTVLCMACAGAKQTVDVVQGVASVIADPKAALDEITKDVREINSDDEKVSDTAKGRVVVKLVRAIVEAVIAKKAGGDGPKAKAPAKPPVSTVAESPAGGGNPAPAKPKPTKPPVQGQDGVPLTAEHGPVYVDPHGNALVTPKGGSIAGSPDGRYIQVIDGQGRPTGARLDGGHKPSTHPDLRAQKPHAHVPGKTNSDGTPWLPVKE